MCVKTVQYQTNTLDFINAKVLGAWWLSFFVTADNIIQRVLLLNKTLPSSRLIRLEVFSSSFISYKKKKQLKNEDAVYSMKAFWILLRLFREKYPPFSSTFFLLFLTNLASFALLTIWSSTLCTIWWWTQWPICSLKSVKKCIKHRAMPWFRANTLSLGLKLRMKRKGDE